MLPEQHGETVRGASWPILKDPERARAVRDAHRVILARQRDRAEIRRAEERKRIAQRP
jgi:hypothetical protein